MQTPRRISFFGPSYRCVTPVTIVSLQTTTMKLLLASVPVSAAVNPRISVNLLSRDRAAVHGIDDTTTAIQLSVTVALASPVRCR
jgi:hypothetical protein